MTFPGRIFSRIRRNRPRTDVAVADLSQIALMRDAGRAGEWAQAWQSAGGDPADLPDLTLDVVQCMLCIAERYASARECVQAAWAGERPPKLARWRVRYRSRDQL